MIDVVGELRIEIAQGIVGQGREMNDSVETRNVLEGEVACVLAQARHRGDGAALGKGAPLVEIGIAADDLVPGRDEFGHHHGPDIAVMAGNQNFHHALLGRGC